MFWRTEVWHALSVHFPIAFLLLALFFKLYAFSRKTPTWDKAGSFLLYLGTLGVWLSIFTGDQAEGIVARKICDPTVLKEHENAAYVVGWVFSSAAMLDIIYVGSLRYSRQNILKTLIAILLVVGAGFLIYTGHLGAMLVYEQGAGVNQPDADCSDF